jgi:hypothetical protein
VHIYWFSMQRFFFAKGFQCNVSVLSKKKGVHVRPVAVCLTVIASTW